MVKGIGCNMLIIEDLLWNVISVRDKKLLICSFLNVLLVDMLCCFVLRGEVGFVGRGEGNGLI